jgi:hypothetical protein
MPKVSVGITYLQGYGIQSFFSDQVQQFQGCASGVSDAALPIRDEVFGNIQVPCKYGLTEAFPFAEASYFLSFHGQDRRKAKFVELAHGFFTYHAELTQTLHVFVDVFKHVAVVYELIHVRLLHNLKQLALLQQDVQLRIGEAHVQIGMLFQSRQFTPTDIFHVRFGETVSKKYAIVFAIKEQHAISAGFSPTGARYSLFVYEAAQIRDGNAVFHQGNNGLEGIVGNAFLRGKALKSPKHEKSHDKPHRSKYHILRDTLYTTTADKAGCQEKQTNQENGHA